MSYTNGLDDPTIFFNSVLYTGTLSANHSITGVGFAPDWVWIKNRGLTGHHMIFDTVRGAGKVMYSNLTDAETTVSGHVTSFDSDGFTLGDNSGKGSSNGDDETYVAWNWKAGGTASSNTDGSITTSVSANSTTGFSIATYTGNKTSGVTIGHGLGAVPSMVIVKNRTAGTDGWLVFHKDIGNTKFLYFSQTNAALTSSQAWNNTTPDSSVVTLGNSDLVNGSGENLVAYIFAEKKAFSKIGSYTGNGNANGTFVFTGFRPAWVMMKRTDSTNDWFIYDNTRNPFNETNLRISANSNSAESTQTTNQIDLLANGFKCRGSAAATNTSGGTYIFMAFAESPFVNSNGVPNNAR